MVPTVQQYNSNLTFRWKTTFEQQDGMSISQCVCVCVGGGGGGGGGGGIFI